ncbi:SOSS complex subunit C isoform X3 [Prionailurus iriomotensis]
MAANSSGQEFSKQEQSCDLGRTGQREKKITHAEPIFNKSSRS